MGYRFLAVFTSVAVLVGGGGILQTGHTHGSADGQPAQEKAPESCVGTLSGRRAPRLLPAFAVWEQFWGDLTSDPAQADQLASVAALNQPVVQQILEVGTVARQRAWALREGSSPELPAALLQARQVDAAESILAGRDHLVRTLDSGALERLQRFVTDLRPHQQYRLPVRGKVVQWDEGPICIVSIKGRDYPQLIPESYTWETYFRVRALGAASERTGPDSYSSRHVQTVRRVDIPIAAEYVVHLLRVATATNDEVNAIYESASRGEVDHDTMLDLLSRLVVGARDGLVRTLPSAAWAAVLTDVRRLQGGTTHDFPGELSR